MVFGIFSGTTANIPQFDQGEEHDSIDLQVKSLLYLFKRLRINRLTSFLTPDGQLKHTNRYEDGQSQSYYQKLDLLYNTLAFIGILAQDEYRVMIDYSKNKFRSYCILSDYPSANLSRPSSPVKGGSNSDNGDFPSIRDYKDRKVRTYRFILLPLNGISVDFIANTLAMSDIYSEHFTSFDFDTRYQYALDSINKVFGSDISKNKGREITMTESEKEHIIRDYLRSLAFNVQLGRIYDEYVKKSRPASPTKSAVPKISAPKLSQRKSIADLRTSRPPSPTKLLSSKPSIARFKLDELYNPVVSPPLSIPSLSYDDSRSDTSGSDFDKAPRTELRMDIYEKCKAAVTEKLRRERESIQRK